MNRDEQSRDRKLGVRLDTPRDGEAGSGGGTRQQWTSRYNARSPAVLDILLLVDPVPNAPNGSTAAKVC